MGRNMDVTDAPFQLLVQDRTFPAPSCCPQVADWLPEFLGFSWLAYGSLTSLVISMAPTPTRKEEAEVGPFLRQIIDIREATSPVSCVGWAPMGPSVGLLAAAAGECVCVYGPEGFPFSHANNPNVSELPEAWIKKNSLMHTFRVLSFAWTESGDGLLSVGTEVVMWKRDESGWCHLWTSHVAHPQLFAAATWSAKGLAATADGDLVGMTGSCSVQPDHVELIRGKATVWWWEDSLGLLEADLIHPQQVLMVQWRPSKGLYFSHRPVLLTACKDGAVRLWLEIDSGRARLDKALGKDVAEKHLKPAYFVSAVIEAEQCLHGILGKDVFVTWALDRRVDGLANVFPSKSAEVCTISKRPSVGACEWLLGLGPDGSIALWSLFCLDDVYPPRCPRVLLWNQATGLIPNPKFSSVSNVKNGISSILIKAVAQRMGDKSAEPPSSLDLFCMTPQSFFQWSRIWPPITAIGGGGSKGTAVTEVANSRVPSISEKTGKKRAWGVATESLHTDGHLSEIVSLSVHPIASTGLVASLDGQGDVLLWYIPTFSDIAVATSALHVPIWKPCGRLVGHREFKTLTWLPTVLSGDRTVLLLGHAGGVDCFLIMKDRCGSGRRMAFSYLVFNFLCTLDLCACDSEMGLEGLWAFPAQISDASNLQRSRSVIIGLGQGGCFIISWKLEISVSEAGCDDAKIQMFFDPSDAAMHKSQNGESCMVGQGNSKVLVTEGNIIVEANLVGIMKLEEFERVISIAVVPSYFLPYIENKTDCLIFEPVALARPYDFATGSADGMLKLWKSNDQMFSDGMAVENKMSPWRCVGALKVYPGPIDKLALGSCGVKIATVGSVIPECGKSIHIWDVESYLDSAGFVLDGKISLPCPSAALEWLEVGNGQSVLGMSTQIDVRVYAEVRVSTAEPAANFSVDVQSQDSSHWSLLASAPLMSGGTSLSWGPKATLVVGFRDHIVVYGQRISRKPNMGEIYQGKSPITWPKLESLGNQDEPFSTLLEMGELLSCPLPVYHPVTVLYHLFTGNHQRARACIWHLHDSMSGLLASLSASRQIGDSNGSLQIPPMHFTDFLQFDRGTQSTQDFQINKRGIGTKTSDSPFDRTNLLDWSTHSLYENKEDSATVEGRYLKMPEVEKFADSIEKCRAVTGLLEDEKNQLLAAADLLEELDSVSKASQYASLDQPGQRFWLSLHFSHSNLSRRTGNAVCLEDLVVDTKAMAWALQSDCKETLLDLCLSDQLSWPAMRAMGVGFWFTDVVQLRMRMEKLARAQYLMRKDPKDCALLYLALKRRNVLLGLLKLSKDDKDRPLVEFLARDFQEERNQAAALKNAYILMGKHRHELAVAFFLLGGDLSSAVAVCAKNLGDLQLALVICRLVEGCDGQIERNLIKEHALPNAKNAGDFWLASLFQWLLGERMQAIEELTGKLKLSFVLADSFFESKKRVICTISPERIGPAFVDPDVGHYCVVLAAKPSIQVGWTAAYAMTLRKWIMSKTSSALRRLGLPLEALEHLSSSLIVMENHSDQNHISNMKEFTRGVEDDLLPDLQVQEDGVGGSISGWIGAEILSAVKTSLALQCQYHLVQFHPHWRFEEFVWRHSIIRPSDSRSKESVVGKSKNTDHLISLNLTEEANEKLIQNLHSLETKFDINIDYVLAALATLAYHQNRMYFQCLLTRGVPDQRASTNMWMHSMQDVTCFPAATYFLGKAAKEIPRFLVYPVLTCGERVSRICGNSDHLQADMQKTFVSKSSMNHLNGGGTRMPIKLQEILLLAFDLKLLLVSSTIKMEPVEDELDCQGTYFETIALLVFTLCCVAAWKGGHADALHILASSFIPSALTGSGFVSNLDSCFQAMLLCKDPGQWLSGHRTRPQVCLDTDDPGRLNDYERWCILGVAFWDALFCHAKKQLSGVNDKVLYKSFGQISLIDSPSRTFCRSPSDCVSPPHASLGLSAPDVFEVSDCKVPGDPNQISSGIEGMYEGIFLKSLACITSAFRRKLVSYINYSLQGSQFSSLSSWLWDNHMRTVGSPLISSSGPASARGGTSEFKSDKVSQKTTSEKTLITENKENTVEELWRLLVVPDNIRSALELEGVTWSKIGPDRKENLGWFTRKSLESLPESTAKGDTVRKVPNGKEGAFVSTVTEQAVKGQPRNRGGRILERSVHMQEMVVTQFQTPEDVLHVNGELFEAMCVNSCCPEQVVIASNRKGLIYLDLNTGGSFSESQDNLWSQAEWPRNGWAMSESTPVPTFVSRGVGLGSKEGSSLGLGGATVGLGTLPKAGKDFSLGGSGFGIPGYGGVGALGLGWEEWEDLDGFVDPPATVQNVSTKALAAHPLRPMFLVGSSNTHVYLWEFGKTSATATYGVLPAANIPPPYALASVSAVRFDHSGHRFATAAVDGTVCTWQLEVGGRSNVRPTESCLCFDRHASDVAFVGASGGILAATGSSPNGFNLVVWDTLAPPNTSRASVFCHEGGARCLALFDHDVGSGSISPLIVTGGKGGDIAVHDFRYIATGKAKRQRHVKGQNPGSDSGPQSSSRKADDLRNQQEGQQSINGMVWYIPKAHAGSVSCVSVVPGTSLFFTGSKDGDVKLWDVSKCELVNHWHKVHDKHMFLQHNARGFGAVVQHDFQGFGGLIQAAVTDVRPLPFGFLTCGGDGIVKLFHHQHFDHKSFAA